MQKTLNQLPKGELFRLANYDKGTVYVKGHYVASEKRFSCHKFDDVNDERFIKSSRLVHSGFTY